MSQAALAQGPVVVEHRLSLAGIDIGDEADTVLARLGNPQSKHCKAIEIPCGSDDWTYQLDRGAAQLSVGFYEGRVSRLIAALIKGPTSTATDSFGISIGDAADEIARWRGAASAGNTGGVVYRTGLRVTWVYGVRDGRVIFIDIFPGTMSQMSDWLAGQLPMIIDEQHDGTVPDRPILVGGSSPQPWVDIYFAGTRCDGSGVWLTIGYKPDVESMGMKEHIRSRCSTSGRERDFNFEASNDMGVMFTVPSGETERVP